MKPIALIITLVACLFISGCKKNDVTGKWKGSMDLPASEANNPQAQAMKGMLSSIPLEFKADHTFTMTAVFPIEGTWTQQDTKVSLTITKMMGMDMSAMKNMASAQGKPTSDVDKPMTMNLSSDGSTLTVTESGAVKTDGSPMTFKRDTGS